MHKDAHVAAQTGVVDIRLGPSFISRLIRDRARSCFSSLVELLLLSHRIPTHKPKSRGGFLDSILPKVKSVLSDVRKSLSVQSLIPDAGQNVSFYTCKRRLVVHGLLTVVGSYLSCGHQSACIDLCCVAPFRAFQSGFVLCDIVLYSFGQCRSKLSSRPNPRCRVDVMHHIIIEALC